MALRSDALEAWRELAEYGGLLDAVRRGVAEVEVGGLPDPAALLLGLALRRHLRRPLVVLAADWPTAENALEALEVWSEGAAPLLFPPRDFLPYAVVAQSPEVHARRIAALVALAVGAVPDPVLVLPASALKRQLPPRDAFAAAILRAVPGAPGDPTAWAARLAASGYERQTVVEAPGTFALRGGILDVFPLDREQPVRIEFGVAGIESVRSFSPETQRSLETLSEGVLLPPAREVPAPEGEALRAALAGLRASYLRARERFASDDPARARLEEQWERDLEDLEAGTAPGRWEACLPFAYPPTSVLGYVPRPAVVLVLGAATVAEAQQALERQEAERLQGFLAEGLVLPEQAQAFRQPLDWQADVRGGVVLYCDELGRPFAGARAQERVTIAGRQAPPTGGQWTLALDALRRWQAARARVVCWVASADRAARLGEALEEARVPVRVDPEGREPLLPGRVHVAVGTLPAGWEVPALGLAALGEAELWGRRARPTRVRRLSAGARPGAYEDLQIGDYVVHATHGIGQYLGTTTMTVQGKVRDYLVLRYEGTDRLYVPTDQIGLVQKYIGAEARVPRLSRLGGGEWARTKQRVRESVRALAEELLALYAARQTLEGHAFAPDGPLHQQFAEAFPYVETPDQLQAIREITEDMERPRPMDRLLCGDVGYGKTEVAMRAAFKAVADGRQVAVLVPTTILAEQHYLTFTERFRGFPVTIRVLSRFRSRGEQEETITALRRGTVDIVIGTHRLLQPDVGFRNLGLLIVDEEHRFGVAAKERLKQLRQTVDVLSMTATPIPRTLHMALAGIRDMSVINTPPENRFPVETTVVEWTPSLIREALHRELSRGGQVYYVHNRVQTIGEAYERLRQLVPDADIVIGHGQMPEEELERVMTEFWRGEHQILLATTIIESGLDIPNANTVIVEDADKLGLAQLYQIRGRVGRSSRVAYAYFTYWREARLSEVAEKRLAALKEFTELGSGFRIAMRDLEIRGAGNLLGPEQHGFVAAVGFELYAQLLEEAVREARGEREVPETRTTVELAVDAYIDDAYVPEARVKLDFYKKIHSAGSPEDVDAVEEELRDRFGPYPVGVANLLRLARIRLAAQRLGLLGILQEGRVLTLTFPNYAQEALGRARDLEVRFARRLRVQPTPRPVVRLQLDGTDDATVLASVEACLEALAAHPALRAGAAPEAATEGQEAASLPPPAPEVPPKPAAPSAARQAPPEPAAASGSRDRIAERLGWTPVPQAPRPPRGPRTDAVPRGPVRAVAPPGLAVPAPLSRRRRP